MRLYLTGLAASLLGNSAMSLVAGIWVKALTGSNTEAGLVSVCVYAPSLTGPLAGLIVDRVNRRRWLIAINLLSAATILTLLSVTSRNAVWVVFVAMSAYGLEIVLIDPAEDALVVSLFSARTRQRFNGWRLGIQETGRLLAPLLGAGLFTLLGGRAVAAMDAVTFLIAAGAVSLLSGGGDRPPLAPRGDLRTELLAGARHIWRAGEIRAVAIAATAVMALSGLGVASQYGLVAGLGEAPAFLGLLTAALGAGSVIASLSSARMIARFGERTLCTIGLVNFAVGNLLRSTHWLAGALSGSFVLGFALPWVFLAVINLAQRKTPGELQGRISAALTLALFGPQAPTQALGSVLIAHTSYTVIYVASAVIATLIAAWLAAPALRPRRA